MILECALRAKRRVCIIFNHYFKVPSVDTHLIIPISNYTTRSRSTIISYENL